MKHVVALALVGHIVTGGVATADRRKSNLPNEPALIYRRVLVPDDPIVEASAGAIYAAQPDTAGLDLGLGFGVNISPGFDMMLRGRVMLGESISSALSIEMPLDYLGVRAGPTVMSIDRELALGANFRRRLPITQNVFVATEVRIGFLLAPADWLLDASLGVGISR